MSVSYVYGQTDSPDPVMVHDGCGSPVEYDWDTNRYECPDCGEVFSSEEIDTAANTL